MADAEITSASDVTEQTNVANDIESTTPHGTLDEPTNSDTVPLAAESNERTDVSPSQGGEEESRKKRLEGQSSTNQEDESGAVQGVINGVVVEDIESHLLPVTDETLEHLTQGFLQAFVPHIETSYNSLDELMRNQRVLIETVQQENVKCNENHLVTELAEVMTEARIYHSKLVNIKKEMTTLHERNTKLKKRALKLQQQKMKENLNKEQQREKEMEQERHLIAKPAAKRGEQASKRTEQATSSSTDTKVTDSGSKAI